METSIKLSDLNEFISCPLCHGYLIDATTIDECLHTFCKSCIVKHIKSNHNECPKCNTIIHEIKPLEYIVHDRSKQDLVYKLVPQLYISELSRKAAVQELDDSVDSITRLVLKKKFLYIVLVQRRRANTSTSSDSPTHPQKAVPQREPIYLNCPLNVKIRHIRKLLAMKYQLEADDRIVILYKGDIVSDNDQVSNLAQSLTFCLHYEISRVYKSYKIESSTDSNESDAMSVSEIK